MQASLFRDICWILLSVIIALILTVMPLPADIVWMRPEWMFLIIYSWLTLAPHRVGIGVAWLAGLWLDIATGSLLGQHAFVFACIGYLVLRFNSRAQQLPLWQQVIVVFVLTMLSAALQYWIMGFAGLAPATWAYWLAPVTSAIIWPVINGLLKRCPLKMR